MSAQLTPNSRDRQRRTRTSKACQECRMRKIKCNGVNPCKHCLQRNADCSYRSINRRAKRSKPRDSGLIPKDVDAEQAETPHEVGTLYNGNNSSAANTSNSSAVFTSDHPNGDGINHSVTATHFASPSCVIQLYYGASSNFAFLQQIHQTLSFGTSQYPGGRQDEVAEGGPGLDHFGQRALYFGTSEASQHAGNLGDVPLTFLSFDLAISFLENYVRTVYLFHPFQPPSELERLTKQLFENPHKTISDTSKTAAILSVLAIGATMAEDTTWAEILAEKAKTIATSLSNVVNLQGIQILLLLISSPYLRTAGPNSSYLYLGSAVRKAFAAGIHRDATGDGSSNKNVLTQEKRTTIWALYFYESLVCFSLGRPSSIVMSDISCPFPENERLIPSFVKLASIASDTMRQIYGYRQSSILDVWRAAQNIQQELQGFAFDTQERFGLSFDGNAQSNDINIEHIFLYNRTCKTASVSCLVGFIGNRSAVYCHILILTFRPFLMIQLSCQKPRPNPSNNNVGGTVSPPARNLSWLLEACKYAVDAAFNLIKFLSKAIEVNPSIRGLKFFSFYVEGACFLLIYDILRDQNATPRNIEGINLALRCLSNIAPSTIVSSNIVTIQKMLSAIEEIQRRPSNKPSQPYHAAGTQQAPFPLNMQLQSTGTGMGGLIDSTQPELLYDAPVNFAAGWATLENLPNLGQNGVTGLEYLDWDGAKVNWEFDMFSTDFGGMV